MELGMKTISAVVLALVLLSACATPKSRVSDISSGMTRDEVIQTLGKPVSTSAGEDVEFLNYVLSDGHRQQAYYVRLRQGKVDAAGKVGDYQSSGDPSLQIHLKPR